MKQQSEQLSNNVPFNTEVKAAYYNILREAKAMLSTIERDELRYSLVREDKSDSVIGTIIHEFVNPMLYLRLEHHSNDRYGIHYGFEQIGMDDPLSRLTALFTRSIYRLTSKEVTAMNIEPCIHCDWGIIECSALYEHLEERGGNHQFQLIKYKAASTKRKQMKAVA